MLEQLKNLAMQALKEKMGPNSLGVQETEQAAGEGADSLIENVTQLLGKGGIGQITEIFGGTGNIENSGLLQNLQGGLANILQKKGMNAEEASNEAKNVAPDLLKQVKDKFLSQNEADKAFDLSNIAGLLGGSEAGGIGNVIDKAKDVFGAFK